jgi:hypothetical protein
VSLQRQQQQSSLSLRQDCVTHVTSFDIDTLTAEWYLDTAAVIYILQASMSVPVCASIHMYTEQRYKC